MAGYSYIGEPGYSIAPPRVKSYGTPGFSNLSVPNQPLNYAGMFTNPDVGNIGADSSALHLANVGLARSGLGNTGASFGGASDSGYGYSGKDLNDINRFMTNPSDPANGAVYQAITKRTGDSFRNSGQFDPYNWTTDNYNNMIKNFPMQWGSSYNLTPPPNFQNINIPLPPQSSGFRF